MQIIISNQSNLPIYEQIKEQLKSNILKGELIEGQMLPSIRTLAKELKVSVITTSRAYSDLEQEGFVKSMQGKGCFVLPLNTSLIQESLLQDIEANLLQAAQTAKIAKITQTELLEMIDIILKEEGLDD